MPPLHPLQDEVAAGLQGQMQMRHQTRLLGDQPPQIVVDRRRIQRRQAQPRQFRHLRQQPAHELAQARPARQIGAVRGDIDPGQHDFLKPALHQRPHLRHDGADRHRAVGPAAKRNDAKRAAVIAALLHLDKGAGAAGELGHQMRRRLARGHDVADARAGAGRPALRLQLFDIAQYPMDIGQRRPCRRVDLRRATGHDDPRVGLFAGDAPDRLTRLPLGLGGHRAGVDDDRVRRDRRLARESAHHLAFVGVQAATKSDDLDAHGAAVLSVRAATRKGRVS